MRRRDFIRLGGAAAVSVALPRLAFAQQTQTKRLGVLVGFPEGDQQGTTWLDAFWMGAAKYGWNQQNLRADYRFFANTTEHAQAPAMELVAAQSDLLFCNNTAALTTVAAMTRTIPIIFSAVSGATLSNLLGIQNFAHPMGNITGFVNFEDDMSHGKNIELLKELLPTIGSVALLYGPDAAPGGESSLLASYATWTARQSLELLPYPIRQPDEIPDAIRSIASAVPTPGLVVDGDSLLNSNRALVIGEVAKYRLVTVWGLSSFTLDGALISYASIALPQYQGAGEYAGLVLNGANPGDLPIQTSPLVLIVNLKTAKEQGITIPTSILARADQVIE